MKNCATTRSTLTPIQLPPNDLLGRCSTVYNMDQDEVHDVIREIRGVLDEFDDRCGIGEFWGAAALGELLRQAWR